MRKSRFSALRNEVCRRVAAMKCAICGHDVDPSSPNCPYCAAGASRGKRRTTEIAVCPGCGSSNVEESAHWGLELVRGTGCMGASLQLFLRMLLWIMGVSPYYHTCLDCGHRWKSRGDWLPVVVLAAAALIVTAVIVGLVMLLF